MNERWNSLADQIADRLDISAGCRVSLSVTDASAITPATALVRAVHQRGGIPQVLLTDEAFDLAALQYADPALLAAPAPLEVTALHWSDVHVALRAMVAPTTEPDPERTALLRQAKGHISTLRWQHTRWAIVRVPTPGWAEMIGVDYSRLERQFFDACLFDVSQVRPGWDRLATDLEHADTIRILADDTDLTLRVGGRRWVVFAGEANLPDGELATAPLDFSAAGFIAFPGTQWFAQQPVQDLRMEFADGQLTYLTAARGEGLARALVDSDCGARRLGELGIGTNSFLTTMTGDLFLDEKILGTVHLALGRAYPQCGGTNSSNIHWDIVKDLRGPSRGSLLIDGRPLIDDGTVTPWFRSYLEG